MSRDTAIALALGEPAQLAEPGPGDGRQPEGLSRDNRHPYAVGHDQEPVWRVEAGAALHQSEALGKLGWLEARSVSRALGKARSDPDLMVRDAARTLMQMKPVRLGNPGPDSVS